MEEKRSKQQREADESAIEQRRAMTAKLRAETAEHIAHTTAIAAEWGLYAVIGWAVWDAMADIKATKKQLREAKETITDAALASLGGPLIYMEYQIGKEIWEKGQAAYDATVKRIADIVGKKIPDSPPDLKTWEEARMRWDRWREADNDPTWLSGGGWIIQADPIGNPQSKSTWRTSEQYAKFETMWNDDNREFRVFSDADCAIAAVTAILAARTIAGAAGSLISPKP